MRQINIPALRASVAPRGLLAVRAQSDASKMIGDLTASLDEFKARHEERYRAIEATLDDMARTNAAQSLNGGDIGSGRAPDPQYSGIFAAYFRRGAGEEEIRNAQTTGGRGPIHAAMTEGSDSEGGYLAPVEWDRRISQAQRAKSPLRRLCDVRATTVGAYSTLWKLTGPGSGWVGETSARPATTTPTFATITFGHGEIYANPAITQRLLDDAEIDVDKWLADEVSEEFGRQEGIAFLAGDGVNKPFGLLGYIEGGAHDDRHPGGSIAVDMSGHASRIEADALIDFTYQLPAPYRQNAAWLMNSATAAAISKLKDGQGNYLWREGFLADQPATLLGRRVEIDEGMPNIEAGAIPILFGDFKAGYVINDRTGVRVLRDPFTNKPFVHFYTTKRVGGGVKDPNALRALKVGVAA